MKYNYFVATCYTTPTSLLSLAQKAPQATSSEGLVQSSYVASRAGFEHATFLRKIAETSNEPPLLMRSGDSSFRGKGSTLDHAPHKNLCYHLFCSTIGRRGCRGKLAGKSVFLQIIGNDNANISVFSPQHTY